jgi:hypothetical protein
MTEARATRERRTVSEIDQQIAAAEAKLAAMRSKASQMRRSEDNHIKAVLGAYLLDALGESPDFNHLAINGVSFVAWLTRVSDRKLFGIKAN